MIYGFVTVTRSVVEPVIRLVFRLASSLRWHGEWRVWERWQQGELGGAGRFSHRITPSLNRVQSLMRALLGRKLPRAFSTLTSVS